MKNKETVHFEWFSIDGTINQFAFAADEISAIRNIKERLSKESLVLDVAVTVTDKHGITHQVAFTADNELEKYVDGSPISPNTLGTITDILAFIGTLNNR